MRLLLRALPYFLCTFIASFILTPLAKRVGFLLQIYAIENKRTVHHGRIVRFGGLAIYLAFIICLSFFMKADRTINAILIASFILFMGGVIDDMFDLKPLIKLAFEIVAAIIVLAFGRLELSAISLPFVQINSPLIIYFVSFCWLIGVSNAINLMDGLDGLAAGLSLIMICTIGMLSYFMGRSDLCIIALLLAGSIAGFLPYNFHPASIFMGDCGALTLGFLIACLSLLGFKSTTFITLAFPIVILFIPLADTFLAICRRKSQGKKISEADRSHLHHILMYKIGLSHRNTVLTLYGVTIAFALTSLLMYFHRLRGLVILLFLVLNLWLFVELTGMINSHFHPLIGLSRRLFGYPKKKENAFFEANKITKRKEL